MRVVHKFKNLYDIDKRIKELWGDDRYTILEDFDNFQYTDVHQHIHIKCNKCGKDYKKEINTFLHGYQCKYCAGRYFSSNKEMKDYIRESTDGEYELISDLYKTRDKALFKHNSLKCKKDDGLFWMKIHGFTVLGHRCPYCAAQGNAPVSHGEDEIKKYLNNHNHEYITQYHIEECKNKQNNSYLYFDFYVKDLNLLIEYDGIQHFEPIDYFGGATKFLQLQENDKIKNTFVENQEKYNLLRIKYTDFKNINTILDRTFNEHQKEDHRWMDIYGILTE